VQQRKQLVKIQVLLDDYKPAANGGLFLARFLPV
jgi:hypothetical protein